MRIDHDIGIYTDHYAKILKWYSLAFKDKHPSKDDEECYNLFNTIYKDMIREEKEEQDAQRDD